MADICSGPRSSASRTSSSFDEESEAEGTFSSPEWKAPKLFFAQSSRSDLISDAPDLDRSFSKISSPLIEMDSQITASFSASSYRQIFVNEQRCCLSIAIFRRDFQVQTGWREVAASEEPGGGGGRGGSNKRTR